MFFCLCQISPIFFFDFSPSPLFPLPYSLSSPPGINPGLYSAYKLHYYAGPGNHFWKCLYLSGLVPEPLSPEDDDRIHDFGIGLTNMVARPTRGVQVQTSMSIYRYKLSCSLDSHVLCQSSSSPFSFSLAHFVYIFLVVFRIRSLILF